MVNPNIFLIIIPSKNLNMASKNPKLEEITEK
jgi:hypothetical protein